MVRSQILQLTEEQLQLAISRCAQEMKRCLAYLKDEQPGAIMGYGDFYIEREIYQEALNVKRNYELSINKSGVQFGSQQ